MSLFEHSIKDLEEKLHNKEITVQDLIETSYHRINEVDEQVQAFLTLNEESVRIQAEELDNETDKSKRLFGIPAGLKDNLMTKDMRTTAGSQILKNFNEPLFNATAVEKLNSEKAVTIGKLNMDEFAMGSSNEKSSFQTTRNPWNTDYVPGGSSGGPAAAVASRQVKFALGSDTGGSIRQPAAFCGVVGMKPTYGLVSRFGLVAFASSMDQIGPITHNVEDNARVLEVIAGQDKMDMTSADIDVPAYTEKLSGDVKGLKIAVPKEYLAEGVAPEVKEAVMDALKVYESLGASWEEVSMPHTKYAVPTYYLLSSAEGSTSLARFDGVRYGERSENANNMIDMYKMSRGEGFGEEVKRRILFGSFALSAGYHDDYFRKAQRVRTLIKQDFEDIFANYDVIIGPTTPTPAFKFGEKSEDPLTMYMDDLLTVPANLAGVPGISVPCGFSEEGLPYGLQIIGKHFNESTVYRAAHAYEQATEHHTKRPALGGEQA